MVKVIVGEESYMIDLELNRARSKYDKLDISTYEATDNLRAIINDCNTTSLFNDKRLVIIKNFTLDIAEDDKKLLENYILNPNPSTELIITSYKPLDKRQKFVKFLESNTKYFNFESYSDDDLKGYVKSYLQEKRIGIESNALDELIFRVDSKMSQLVKELEKLGFYKDEGTYINLADIDLLVSYDINKRIYDLAKYVLDDNKQAAINLYNELKLYVDEMQLIALITSNLRLSYLCKKFMKFTKDDNELASLLNVNTKRLYFIKKNANLDLFPLLKSINEMDLKIKSGQVDKETAFTLFLME